jgi:hypothetical protein
MKIFISYKSINRAIVHPLITDLEDMGHTVWYDQELEGGQVWWDNILENIRSCDLFIFALTPQSLDSYPCQLEYTYANACNRTIMPVELIKIPNFNLVPQILQERQLVKYTERNIDTYKKLFTAINQVPFPTPPPATWPDPPKAPISPLATVRSRIDVPDLSYEEQISILHQLKAYLYHEEYDKDSRELLTRLSQHPKLLASVDKDIQTALAIPQPSQPVSPTPAPPPAPSVSSGTTLKDVVQTFVSASNIKALTDADEAQASQAATEFQLEAGETILKQVFVSFSENRALGLASGIITAYIGTVKTVVDTRKSQRSFIITERRLVFIPGLEDATPLEIPINQIAQIKRGYISADPIIQINTKSGEEYKFSIVAAGGMGFGNRGELIQIIESLMSKS